MIDVMINAAGGVTVAHTLKALDGYEAIEIGMSDGLAMLIGPKGTVVLGTLKPAVLETVRPGMAARSVRTSGWSISKVSDLSLHTRHDDQRSRTCH